MKFFETYFIISYTYIAFSRHSKITNCHFGFAEYKHFYIKKFHPSVPPGRDLQLRSNRLEISGLKIIFIEFSKKPSR